MTAAGRGVSPLTTEASLQVAGDEQPRSTRIHMDFGRISVDRDLLLYLFTTPAGTRYWFARRPGHR
jgi:signal recognition particle receptor subunit beta